MGVLIDRVHRELTAEEIKKVSDCYYAWKSKDAKLSYADGLSHAADPSEHSTKIRSHDYRSPHPVATSAPEEIEDDGEPFEEKMKRLTTALEEQFKQSAKLEQQIRKNLANPEIMSNGKLDLSSFEKALETLEAIVLLPEDDIVRERHHPAV